MPKRGGITREDVERVKRLIKETLFYREFFKPEDKITPKSERSESPSSARDPS